MEKTLPVGSAGIFAATQSRAAGVPEPAVAGNWITPIPLPPNSPVTMPKCDPGAIAMPLVPADKLKSGKFCTAPGAVHVPGEPDVKLAWLRSVMKRLLVNSIVASAMPVVQSSAEESNSPPGEIRFWKNLVPLLSVLNNPYSLFSPGD